MDCDEVVRREASEKEGMRVGVLLFRDTRERREVTSDNADDWHRIVSLKLATPHMRVITWVGHTPSNFESQPDLGR